MSKSDGRKMASVMKRANQKDLLFIRDLLEEGKIRPVIDECYPLVKQLKLFGILKKATPEAKWS